VGSHPTLDTNSNGTPIDFPAGSLNQMRISTERFGILPTGEAVQIFSLSNNQGVEAKITNYGGIVVAINVPDRNGKIDDVVLGHDSLEGYLNRSRYFGALCGRYANRIAEGRFRLHGIEYKLATNNGPNHLHGGLRGFDKVVWTADARDDALELTYFSRDGEEGYPGNLTVTINYSLSNENALRIEYFATTDKDTIINLTNHSYFNLAPARAVLDHVVTIHADVFTPIDHTLIPTGELRAVAGTPMDFNSPSTIGARINADDEQLQNGGGYDHNFVLRDGEDNLRPVAEVYEPETGRVLTVLTTQPGMQFYSGNFLNGTIFGKNGRCYTKHSGFCLETQHFPDSPNHPNFPSTVLRPVEQYHHVTVFKFSLR
jgi:aldose 1-epimerase